jgi:hypothetical protein
MRTLELVFAAAAGVALVLWRGLALYRQTFRRNRL